MYRTLSDYSVVTAEFVSHVRQLDLTETRELIDQLPLTPCPNFIFFIVRSIACSSCSAQHSLTSTHPPEVRH